MATKSSKAQQGAVSTVRLRFDGGINSAQSPSQIAENELVRAYNVIYDIASGTPMSRPGTECITASALANPILKLYYYEKNSSTKYLIAVSGGKLYYLSTDHWHEIGSLTNSTTVPSMITYHAKLLIADGGTNIRTWDGTTYATLSDGLKATSIVEISGRVAVNSVDSPDLVTLSGPNDETKWNTSTEGAVAIRAGFGDNMAVNGLSVFGTDLIISKIGSSNKAIYRLSTAGATSNWQVSKLTENNAAVSHHVMCSAFNNVYFIDSDSIKSIKGVTEYGDLQIDIEGAKVDPHFCTLDYLELSYLPKYSAIWCISTDRIYAYHRVYGQVGAFTMLNFNQGRINSIVQAGDTVYLAGNNGHLYTLSDTAETDETVPDTTSAYNTTITTKRIDFIDAAILRTTSVGFKSVSTVTDEVVQLFANTPDKDGIKLKDIIIKITDQDLYDATGKLDVALTPLSAITGSAWLETTTNRVRGRSLQWRLSSTSGRWGLEGLQAEIALVEG